MYGVYPAQADCAILFGAGLWGYIRTCPLQCAPYQKGAAQCSGTYTYTCVGIQRLSMYMYRCIVCVFYFCVVSMFCFLCVCMCIHTHKFPRACVCMAAHMRQYRSVSWPPGSRFTVPIKTSFTYSPPISPIIHITLATLAREVDK